MIFYFSVVLSFLGLSNITTTMPATSTTPTIIATAATVLKVAPEEAADVCCPGSDVLSASKLVCAALSAVHRSHGLYPPQEQE